MPTKIQSAVETINANNVPVEKRSASAVINSLLDGEGMRKRINELLGDRAPQFISSIVTVVNGSPELQRALSESPLSIISAGLRAASYDLPIDPDMGYAYIVPFKKNTKQGDTWVSKTEAKFILGWKGMNQLALRTGAYKVINVTDVRQGELKYFNRLTEECLVDFIEDEDERESKEIIGYLGYYRLNNGATKLIYRTKKAIENHEKENRQGQNMTKGWRENWDAMARKTLYRELLGKYGVMSITYQSSTAGAMLADQMAQEMADEKEQPLNAEYVDASATQTQEPNDN